jgi:hypothetical protein
MTDLYASIIRTIERIIQGPLDGFSSAIFPGAEAEWPRQGRFFSLQKDGSAVIIYPWFGIYDTAIGPIIYIGLNGESGWCQPVYIPALENSIDEGHTFRRPYNDLLRRELCFALKNEQVSTLVSTTIHPEREKLLFDFFAEVIVHIGRYLE